MPIERMWSEVNSRVNYPIKRKLISLVNDGCLDMNDETVKFCVSFITCQVVHACRQWQLTPLFLIPFSPLSTNLLAQSSRQFGPNSKLDLEVYLLM